MTEPKASAVGLDLAWSARNPTGACALDAAGHVIAEGWLGSDDDILAWLAAVDGGGPLVVAIDAPLHVPNETGRRPCESAVSRAYGGRKAGPHSSNRGLPRTLRGEALLARLPGCGGPWSGSERTVLEVYPHPALIEVFGLAERLPYKKGTPAARRDGLRRLAGMVASLRHADPPLLAPPLAIGDGMRGATLKAAEDLLDARFCAWVAALWRDRGAQAFTVYGDPGTGHIAVPIVRA